MDSIWNKDLNIECETIKLIEQVVGEYYCDLEAETLKPSNQVSVNWKKKKKATLYLLDSQKTRSEYGQCSQKAGTWATWCNAAGNGDGDVAWLGYSEGQSGST